MNKKLEFSKKLCIFSIILLCIVTITATILSILGYDTSVFTYIISGVCAMVSICLGFYFNKAKAENLSKQRLRTVLIRLVLEGKLDEESYEELLVELSSIDQTLENRLAEMHDEAINEEVDTSINI